MALIFRNGGRIFFHGKWFRMKRRRRRTKQASLSAVGDSTVTHIRPIRSIYALMGGWSEQQTKFGDFASRGKRQRMRKCSGLYRRRCVTASTLRVTDVPVLLQVIR
ncbi:hypothetical protein EVAR_80576_1 [Eumeta japonica]|uniref:Uncharacterized protein n=1 Tax=Eumeta variegata TaxID=151549 RepID=A0A4C1TLM1_EUMVA|nr:hypothetical protein EVAR_80576_1 [Eumeta japonica]